MVDPQRMDEHEERGGVDLQVDPVAMVTPARLAVGAAGTPPRGAGNFVIATGFGDVGFRCHG